MKKEIILNLMKLRALGVELGLFVEEVSVLNFYLESPFEILPKKILGIKIVNGGIDEIIINSKKID